MKTNFLRIVPLLLGISLQACIVYYLDNLEKIGCVCAMNGKRMFIFAFAIFSILLNTVQLFTDKLPTYLAKYPIAMAGIAALGISYIVVTLIYIEDIKKANCNCSESVFRDMMYYLSIISACLWGFIVVFFVSGLYQLYILNKHMNKIISSLDK